MSLLKLKDADADCGLLLALFLEHFIMMIFLLQLSEFLTSIDLEIQTFRFHFQRKMMVGIKEAVFGKSLGNVFWSLIGILSSCVFFRTRSVDLRCLTRLGWTQSAPRLGPKSESSWESATTRLTRVVVESPLVASISLLHSMTSFLGHRLSMLVLFCFIFLFFWFICIFAVFCFQNLLQFLGGFC